MARSALNSPNPQLALAFDPADGPQAEDALRSQYLSMQISRRMSFAEAMSDRALAICIRNLTAASARRRQGGIAA